MSELLGPAEIRDLAARLRVRPTKALGQNFVHDANTVRRIVAAAALDPSDIVLEVGPGLGSLTLGLLPAAAHVHAVEVDPTLAAALPETVKRKAPEHADRLTGGVLRASGGFAKARIRLGRRQCSHAFPQAECRAASV